MKTSWKNVLALAFASMCAAAPALAQRVDVKGVGTYQVEGKSSGNLVSADERAKALASAKTAAWRSFVASMSPARQQVIAQHEGPVLAQMDKFIIESVVIDSLKDTETRVVKVVARFAFNEEAVGQFLGTLAVGNGDAAARSQDSLFSFLFMARKATAITRFDARRNDVRQVEEAATTQADGGRSAMVSESTGGSTQQKEDAISYAVASSQDLDAAMGEVLSTAGIEYVGYDDIVSNCNGVSPKKFQAEFVGSDELTPETRAAIINAARACEVRYFAYGTVDTQVASTDPVSGNQRVYVAVRSQLWDISRKLPRKIGSVGPKQYSGLGQDQHIASRNALSIASRDLAKTLVDQLNAKGIR